MTAFGAFLSMHPPREQFYLVRRVEAVDSRTTRVTLPRALADSVPLVIPFRRVDPVARRPVPAKALALGGARR